MWLTGVRGTSLAVLCTSRRFLLYKSHLIGDDHRSSQGHDRVRGDLETAVEDSPAARRPALSHRIHKSPTVAGEVRVQSR